MSKFIGVKMVEAVPMTASEALQKDYRVGQNGTIIGPTTEGYEVTYPDGYKSWCPKDVFEKNNIAIFENNLSDTVVISNSEEDYIKRLGVEHNELVDKYNKLTSFLITEKFNKLREDRKNRLRIQHTIMQAYVAILQERIDDACQKNDAR